MSEFDSTRARLNEPDLFPRFRVPDHGRPLCELPKLKDKAELLIIERGGQRLGLDLVQMAWHHLAQGSLGGQPYAATF